MRIAVYTDYAYRSDGDHLYAERAFALFLVRLAEDLDRLVLVGRLRSDAGTAAYPIPDGVPFVPLPYYETLARPLKALRAMARSMWRFWHALDEVDAVWLLGPHPLAVAFAVEAAVRRRRVILGVREDLPVYVESRHPGRRSLRLAAAALDRVYRLLSRRCPTVVVGPGLRQKYRHAQRLLEVTVSLVTEDQIIPPAEALSRRYDGELTVLSVGRLEREKNPLILADVLAGLNENDHRWRLIVCGEGPMSGDLSRRLAEAGVSDRAAIRGYVPFGPELFGLYASSHAFLHVSWTEGLPQVLLEAFAAGTPVVATDVGGVRAAVGEAVLLVPPGDFDAAVRALRRLAGDAALRDQLVRAGHGYVCEHSQARESRRLADFLQPG